MAALASRGAIGTAAYVRVHWGQQHADWKSMDTMDGTEITFAFLLEDVARYWGVPADECALCHADGALWPLDAYVASELRAVATPEARPPPRTCPPSAACPPLGARRAPCALHDGPPQRQHPIASTSERQHLRAPAPQRHATAAAHHGAAPPTPPSASPPELHALYCLSPLHVVAAPSRIRRTPRCAPANICISFAAPPPGPHS